MYLDGQTKMQERGKMVDAFNKGKGYIFLISLKAGGTGLNLTGADVVIHYDPWWNPAVEQQASDRAHRIGQKKTVEVIKLIARGTIEEKIYELQEKKRDIIKSVMDMDSAEESIISRMSEEEIKDILSS
jgi:SNF2 family DNA or RNA helicase